MPWYTTADAWADAEMRQRPDGDGYAVNQIGELWYVVDNRGGIRSQGYRTQAMADLKRQSLERERERQTRTIYREGGGHD